MALADCVRAGGFDTGQRLVNALIEYWTRRGHAASVLDSVRRIVDEVRPIDSPAACDALGALSQLEVTVEDMSTGRQHAQDAVQVARLLGDPARIARHLSDIAWIAFLEGQDQEAIERRARGIGHRRRRRRRAPARHLRDVRG